MTSQERQRIAIAEACGTMKWGYGLPEKCIHCDVPDYLNDLNAMHEAEKVLTGAQVLKYADELNKATKYFKHVTPAIMCMATAAQRAEAFLKTLDKWE